MPLSSQRFRDDDTLLRCVEEAYRMKRGERDRESPYPDHPDPSADGLAELAEATAAEAAEIVGKALDVLENLSWGGPPASPHEEEIRSALRTYTAVDAGSSSHETQEYRAHLRTLLGDFPAAIADIGHGQPWLRVSFPPQHVGEERESMALPTHHWTPSHQDGR